MLTLISLNLWAVSDENANFLSTPRDSHHFVSCLVRQNDLQSNLETFAQLLQTSSAFILSLVSSWLMILEDTSVGKISNIVKPGATCLTRREYQCIQCGPHWLHMAPSTLVIHIDRKCPIQSQTISLDQPGIAKRISVLLLLPLHHVLQTWIVFNNSKCNITQRKHNQMFGAWLLRASTTIWTEIWNLDDWRALERPSMPQRLNNASPKPYSKYSHSQ